VCTASMCAEMGAFECVVKNHECVNKVNMFGVKEVYILCRSICVCV
jgi:hypothetical protein